MKRKSVTKSSLFDHLPPPEKRNGAAVIICPGGAYAMVSLNNEGHDVAQWFNEQGVAGFVLKYRLPGKNGNPAGCSGRCQGRHEPGSQACVGVGN